MVQGFGMLRSVHCAAVAGLLFGFSSAGFGQDFVEWDEGLSNPRSDPQNPKWSPTLSFGQYKGQSIDTERWQFAESLTPEQRKQMRDFIAKLEPQQRAEKYFGMQTILHEGRRYFAAMPAEVESVYFLTQYFGPKIPYFMPDGILGHSYLHFRFPTNRPAILLPVDGVSEPLITSDLVMSAEAGRPKGLGFSPIGGGARLFGTDYVSVTGFYSAQSELTRAENATIKAYGMELDARARSQVLQESLRQSLSDGFGRTYATWAGIGELNCHATNLCVIDRASGRFELMYPSLRGVINVLKRLPEYVVTLFTRPSEIFKAIGRTKYLSPFEFYPVFARQALSCRDLLASAQSYLELPGINALLKPKG